MKGSAQSQPIATSVPSPVTYACDLCSMPVPGERVHTVNGQILGLITCSLCVEDALAARTLEAVT